MIEQFLIQDQEVSGLEDWLIPSHELTGRRLIKQTARHNVYEADWFGDVLVYEPRDLAESGKTNSTVGPMRGKTIPKHRVIESNLRQRLNAQELHLRLESIRSNKECPQQQQQQQLSPALSNLSSSSYRMKSRSQQSLISDFNESSIDSAYSSNSSTPSFNQMNSFGTPRSNNNSNLNRTQFEFPSRLSSPKSIPNETFSFNDQELDNEAPLESPRLASPPNDNRQCVVLNKESYAIKRELTNRIKNDLDFSNRLKELNELRLIAHEGFMLFMGASLDQNNLGNGFADLNATNQTFGSLVIQMNHPKAVTLSNLLHLGTTTIKNMNTTHSGHIHSSTTDRFNSGILKLTSSANGLPLEVKLNISQQVTNAMTYLHDKDIVHGRLSSTNIYIEPNQRVKISLVDEHEGQLSEPCASGQRVGVRINPSSLTYLSPELCRSIRLDEDRDETTSSSSFIVDPSKLTKMSDIFSFGTILYELFYQKLPFMECREPGMELSSAQLIYLIGSGQMGECNLASKQQANLNQVPTWIRQLISGCWNSQSSARPPFKQIHFA